MFTGPGASEEAVKRHAGGCRVLHLATHGFYLEGTCGKAAMATPRQANLARENPLLLSGLLLAGANRDAEEARRLRVDDGVLTALEVAGLNLAGTQLVVLSACESAAGDVKAGEGVYGLRRAFALAGAGTVVSALWPVSDWSTIPLVMSLYQESKASIPERMQKAALDKLADLRRRGEVDHPYLWAAFVAQ
jgi:CHAT domain-containing protein